MELNGLPLHVLLVHFVVVLVPLTALCAVVVPSTPLIQEHAALGRGLYPWVLALFVFSALQWTWFFFVDRPDRQRRPSRPVRVLVVVVLAVAAAVLAAGTIVDVVLIGEAGSRAIWENSFSPTPLPTTTPVPTTTPEPASTP